MNGRVLIVDDEESICWGLSRLCREIDVDCDSAASAEQGIQLAQTNQYDVVVTDIRLPGMDGLSAIKHFREQLPGCPIIVITAFGDLKTAIDVVQKGAFEYIVKPFDLNHVRNKLLQALSACRLTRQPVSTPDAITDEYGLIGSSPLMQQVFKQIALTTTSGAPVLITGESGTGKEVTARAIHHSGPRASGPFIPVNIASLNPNLAESELFGHAQGAFTGADSNRDGLLQKAHGGTLFLDEIAEVPISIQVKLLRVLDQNEFSPVGSTQLIQSDFRLISATNQNLLAQINHGEFRHDLFYRLRTFEIQLPPLRERKEDIPQLVHFFLTKSRANQELTPTTEFLDALSNRNWPGNLRELQSVVERAATHAMGGYLSADHIEPPSESPPGLPIQVDLDTQIQDLIKNWTRANWSTSAKPDALYDSLISVIETAVLPTAFELSDGQYSAAARRLGIHRTTLKRKLDELGNG